MKAKKPNRAGTPRSARSREDRAGVRGKSTNTQPPARRRPSRETTRSAADQRFLGVPSALVDLGPFFLPGLAPARLDLSKDMELPFAP